MSCLIKILLAGLCASVLVFAYFGVPWVYSMRLRESIRRKTERHRVFAITFDDGPGRKLTPVILDILLERNVKATFFLSGFRIRGSEDIVRRIAREGHEICSHGMEHLNYLKVSPLRAIRDIKRGWVAIDAALGVNHGRYPFRPPYGKLNLICLLYLLACRVPVIYWTVDIKDTSPSGPDSQMLAHLLEKSGGAVVLGHDFDRDDDAMAPLVIDSVRTILKVAPETKMRVMTVSQLLNER